MSKASEYDREPTSEERRYIETLATQFGAHAAGISGALDAAARHPEWWAYWAPIVAGIPGEGRAARLLVEALPVEVVQ